MMLSVGDNVPQILQQEMQQQEHKAYQKLPIVHRELLNRLCFLWCIDQDLNQKVKKR